MLIPRQLFHKHGPCLPTHPALALHRAQQVDRPVSFSVDDGGFPVGKSCVIVALSCRDAAPVQTMNGDTRRLQSVDQRFGVLPHGPAIFVLNVFEEALIVFDGVGGVRGGHQNLVRGPGVGVGEEPGGGYGRSLLGANL